MNNRQTDLEIAAQYGVEPPVRQSLGAMILDDVYEFTGRFIAYPSKHAHVAHVLWVAHTHLMDAWESTARLAFLSPEPASGKTLEGWDLRTQPEKWAANIERSAGDHWPDMPDGIADRDADIWEPLLTVADLARGEWPERARVAAVALVAESKREPVSLSIRLLKDLWSIFGDREAMSTEDILAALHAMEEAPWSDWHGKPITPRGLAAQLRKYEITSKPVRIGDFHGKGYTRADLWDARTRYLPKPESEAVTDVTDTTSDSDWS